MKAICLLLLLGISAIKVFPQYQYKGKIVDATSKEPIEGAMIVVPGTTTGTYSNAQGSFSLEVINEIDTLVVSAMGYFTQPVTTKKRENLVIFLESETLNTQEIIISANREEQNRSEAPVAIHKISPQTLDQTKATLLSEVLNKVPGVVMVNLNNEQHAMSIRQPLGYNAYFLYLEDGIPLRPTGVFNHNALIEMNLQSVNSIEVIKGPSSSLYGSEAIGGAVNFITQKPSAIPTAKLGLQMDNFGYLRTQFNAGGYLSRNFGIQAGGYWAKQRDSWQTFSDYEKISVNLRADYHLKNTMLTASITSNDYDSEMGGSVDSSSYYQREYKSLTDFAYRKVKATRVRLTAKHRWTENSESTLTAFYRKNSIGQLPAYAIKRVSGNPSLAHGEINENAFHSAGIIQQNSFKFNFLQSKLIAGIVLDYSPNTYWAYYLKIDRDPSTNLYTAYHPREDSMLVDYNARLLNSGVYAQYEITLAKRIKAVAGVRYDRIDFHFDNHLTPSAWSGAPDENNGFDNFSPKLGITCDMGKQSGGYVNYSRGFSPPTLTQLYRGVKVPELQPAYFDNAETGGWMYFLNKKIFADVAIYYMAGRNEIINFLLPNNSTEYRNSGKTRHYGIEYNVMYTPVKNWIIRFGGTNARHEFVEYATKEGQNFDGKEMPNSPHWIANAEITYFPRLLKNFRIGMEYQRISSYYKDNANQYSYEDKGAFGLKGVSVLNLRTGYKFSYGEVFINILNLTDELYATIVTRGNFGDSYTPAAPRTFTFGLIFNFLGNYEKSNTTATSNP